MNYSTLSLVILFTSISFFSKGQEGFIGKKSSISTDFYEMLFDRSINLEVAYFISHNKNLTAGFSLINTANRNPDVKRDNEFYRGQKGFGIDLRYLLNSPLTGQIAPFGHYYGYEISYYSITQVADTKPLKNNSSSLKENNFHALGVSSFYGKSFILSKSCFLSLDLSITLLSAYQANIDDYELLASSPKKFLNLGGGLIGFNNDEPIVSESNNFQFGVFLKPSIKLCYLVF
ncbi:MAG: hypothetical protein JXQ87_12495 [Bacteroidia bacterium]